MTALNKSIDIPRKEAGLQSYPVAATTKIYKGALVCLNSTGFLVAAADTAGLKFAGVAYEAVDNSAGLDGALKCRVHTLGVFRYAATGITQAMLGQPMYVKDDQTIDDTSTNKVMVGRLVEFESIYVGWIDIGQQEMAVGAGPDNLIFVSKRGSASGVGTIHDPFSTITAALAAVTTARKTIFADPGDYAEAAILTWPNINGVAIIGTDLCGSVVISNADGAAAVLSISPTYTAESFEVFLENICIKHDAQIGIRINNTNMTKKLIIHLKNVSTEQVTTGDSIDVAHSASDAIRIYAEGCDEIEGLVDIDSTNTDDRWWFTNCTLIGGLTEVGAVASSFLLHCCVVLYGALSVDGTMVTSYKGSMTRTDAGVFADLTDAINA